MGRIIKGVMLLAYNVKNSIIYDSSCFCGGGIKKVSTKSG